MSDSRSRFAALLFTDIVNSTGLKGDYGVPAYSAALQRHNFLFESLGERFSGMTIVKNTGDGYFAIFPGIADAVRFGLLFQHAMRSENWGTSVLTTRVGIHAGEVADIETLGQADVVAPAADMAARIMSLALGGQVLLTRTPFDEARHFLREHPAIPGWEAEKLPALRWLAHGPYRAKGADESLDVFEVGADGLAPLMPPPDSGKVKRAIRAGEEDVLGWRPGIGLEVPERPGWKLVNRLGAGGFGEVWVAEHSKLGERRAFKFCFDDDRLRGLKREVTLTRLLRTALGDRDDIVRFFELKLDEPPFYLESEYAPEGNLLQWAERQGGLATVPLETRIEIVAASATALAAAHSVGVLHKDIKPANILIFRDKQGNPRPRLVDFGIGTLSDAEALARHGVTGAGFTMASMQNSSGTPLYSPPEFLAGRPYTVQGDVYGLGVMLYQLVVADPDRPLAPGWERDIDDPLIREDIAACVDGVPARRLAGTAELATRLRALSERRMEIAREEAAKANDLARRRRQRTLILSTSAAIIVAVLTVPLTIWAIHEKDRAMAAKGESDLAKARAMAGEKLAVEEREKSHTQVLEASRADFATAQARFAEGKWQEAVAYLGRSLRYDPENRHAREALWIALLYGARDAGRLPLQTLKYNAPVIGTAFSGDGQRILTIAEDGTVGAWSPLTGEAAGREVKLSRSANDKVKLVAAAFSPDSQKVATATEDDVIQIWNADTGKPEGSPIQHPAPIAKLSFTASGREILTDAVDRVPRVWDVATSQPVTRWEKTIGDSDHLAVSPNEEVLVASTPGKNLVFFNPAKNTQWLAERDMAGLVSHIVFSPDSTRVLTAGDGWVRQWDVLTGKSVGTMTRFNGKTTALSYSADGSRWLVGFDLGRVRVFDAQTGRAVGSPILHGPWLSAAAFSPDGAYVITASRDRPAQVWPLAMAPMPGIPLPHRAPVSRIAFDSVGTQVNTVCEGIGHAWATATGQRLPEARIDAAAPNPRTVTRDGKLQLVRKSENNEIELRNVATGFSAGKPMKHYGFSEQEALSADGSRAVTMPESSFAQIWDPVTGKEIGAPIRHQEFIEVAVFSPDGSQLLTATCIDGAKLTSTKDGHNTSTSPPVPTGIQIDCAAFVHGGQRFLIGYSGPLPQNPGGLFQMYDSATGLPIGPSLQQAGVVDLAEPNPAGDRIVTAGTDHLARIWDISTPEPLPPDLAAALTAFAAGARLDRQLGILVQIGADERQKFWKEVLLPALAEHPRWRYAAELSLPLTPKSSIAPSGPLEVREISSRLLASLSGRGDAAGGRVLETQNIDPSYPLLPFAMAIAEASADDGLSNLARARWLCDYGVRRLPKNLAAADLRRAARWLIEASGYEGMSGQKAVALSLLKRAVQTEPENDEGKELRKLAGG